MKNLPKIFKIFFLSIFILQLIGFIVLLVAPMASQAADVKFTPQVTIPDGTENPTFKANKETAVGGTSIAQYINAVYKYAIGIVGILATVVMMFGGFLYLMAGGDSGKLSEAKEWIKASITGLIIALSSYMILSTISSNLVSFKSISPDPISKLELGCCPDTQKNTCAEVSQASCSSGWIKGGTCGDDGKCSQPGQQGAGGTGLLTYQWASCGMNQLCNCLEGDWTDVNESNCSGTKPGLGYRCCGKN